jgi:NADH dehydrogenase
MLLLAGSSGSAGCALRRRLIADGVPLRCLVRDPRRLGVRPRAMASALGVS